MTGEVILQLLLGGLLGVAGQTLRIIVGLKKLNDDAKDQQKKFTDMIEPGRLLISLLIGFVAGLLAIVAVSTFDDSFLKGDADGRKKLILGIIAAGYSGTDFIEGFVAKYLPKK
jgi:hypothetical protein